MGLSIDINKMNNLLEALMIKEEPFGMFYTDEKPEEGKSPNKNILPSKEDEEKNEVDWRGIFENFACVIEKIKNARRVGTVAYFDREHYGCLGGAFYLGFFKPQLDFITHYVSTGIPGVVGGEYYVESSELTRSFFNQIDPVEASARYCVFKPISMFQENETPLLIQFFARPEQLSGLHFLATYVTNDLEAVVTPWGPNCAYTTTWAMKYLSEGKMKAVLGGWDPSSRKYLKGDELIFTMPLKMFEQMVDRWEESFLKTKTWEKVQGKINKSQRVWKDKN